MVGISYFAMAQIAAAVEHPPHLRALFPLATTSDSYRGVMCPGGVPAASFIVNWLNAVGTLAGKGADFWRSALARAASAVLRTETVHRRFEHFDGEAVFNILGKVMPGHAEPHPWDDLIRAWAYEHPLLDKFWEQRDFTARLHDVRVPTYLGCDWDNVPMHLSCTFPTYEALPADAPKRVALLPRGGLAWPWESLHVEALAWFDRWLKGRDTGVDEGPPIRYFLEEAGEWRATTSWPPPEARFQELHLCSDGRLAPEEGAPGERSYLYESALLPRPRHPNPPELPSQLVWDTASLGSALDIAGPLEVLLDAATSAVDADWIVKLSDVAPDGTARDLTQGWLRASHRAIDLTRSRTGAPYRTHDRVEPVTPGARVAYRVGIVTTAHRFAAGHRVRLALTSCDHGGFAMQGMEHVPLAESARHTIQSSSRLVLPVLPAA
jgi:putative CocE/NonD family hydrolase